MPSFSARPATRLAFLTAAAVACGGGDGPGPSEPDPPVLTSVSLSPGSSRLFTIAPGNAVTLTAAFKDQYGASLSPGAVSYSSGDDAVATVDATGAVTAAGAGTTQITGSATAGGVTASGTAAVTVEVAPSTARVDATAFVYQPVTQDLSAGGTVTWVIASVPHTVTFTTPGAPENVAEVTSVEVSRTFPNPGLYAYRCLLHAAMVGSVRVH